MITAIILAAGQSKRMGKPKMLLSWGKSTVLEKVLSTFNTSGVEDILVVTGGDREQVEALINNPVRSVFNPEFARYEMLSSVKAGLAKLKPGTEAILIGLGDQPQVQERSVKLVIQAYTESQASIVVPSFQMRRGHPWLVDKSHWDEIRLMQTPESLREFLKRHASEILYVNIDNDSILQDLDTPEDYLKFKP